MLKKEGMVVEFDFFCFLGLEIVELVVNINYINMWFNFLSN